MLSKTLISLVPLLATALAQDQPDAPVPSINDIDFAAAVRQELGTPPTAFTNLSTNANCDPSQTDPNINPRQAYNNTLFLFNSVCADFGGVNPKSFNVYGLDYRIGGQTEDVTMVTEVVLYATSGCQGQNYTLPANASGTCFHPADLGANIVYSAKLVPTYVPTSSLPPKN